MVIVLYHVKNYPERSQKAQTAHSRFDANQQKTNIENALLFDIIFALILYPDSGVVHIDTGIAIRLFSNLSQVFEAGKDYARH